MTISTTLLDFFRRGEVARDVRLLAARGALAPRAAEQLAILALLVDDPDPTVRAAAGATLARIPPDALRAFLAQPEVDPFLREFFEARGVAAGSQPAADGDAPLIEADTPDEEGEADQDETSQSAAQRIAKMGFSQRLRSAIKGSREMRAVLIRDANKMIAIAVLSSPRVTEQEIEGYARMSSVSEDVLRAIAGNRGWIRHYGIVVSLTRNPKTPVAASMRLMNRLNDRDTQVLSLDRNVPEPLRVAARRKVLASASAR